MPSTQNKPRLICALLSSLLLSSAYAQGKKIDSPAAIFTSASKALSQSPFGARPASTLEAKAHPASSPVLLLDTVTDDDVVTAAESNNGFYIRGRITVPLAHVVGIEDSVRALPIRPVRQPAVRLKINGTVIAANVPLLNDANSATGGSQFEYSLNATQLAALGVCDGKYTVSAELVFAQVNGFDAREVRFGGTANRTVSRLRAPVNGQPDFVTTGGEAASQGGLSGLDWDPIAQSFWTISDSKTAPRAFQMNWNTETETPNAPVTVSAPLTLGSANTYDGEGIRVYRNACGGGHLFTVSEGLSAYNRQPSIDERNLAGSLIRSFTLPTNLRFIDGLVSGPRDNLIFEGLALSPDGSRLFVSLEQGLVTDGEAPTHQRDGMTRIVEFDRRTGQTLAQYAYKMDANFVPVNGGAPTSVGASFTGVSEILALDNKTLLVLERSIGANTGLGIRIYKISLQNAIDVGTNSLTLNSNATSKTLLAQVKQIWLSPLEPRVEFSLNGATTVSGGGNLWQGNLSGLVGNFEGMSYNGAGKLVLLSDNNFNPQVGSHSLTFDVDQ